MREDDGMFGERSSGCRKSAKSDLMVWPSKGKEGESGFSSAESCLKRRYEGIEWMTWGRSAESGGLGTRAHRML